jgi:hypothetical protein
MVSWFVPQNQTGFVLSIVPQNRRMKDDTRHTSRYGGLLHVEASHARIFQSGLKTGGGATTGGVHGIIMEVTSRGS